MVPWARSGPYRERCREASMVQQARSSPYQDGVGGRWPVIEVRLGLTRSSSLGDSSAPQRHIVAIVKEDKETFGFEIQTTRFPHQNDYSPELCTCVCKIQEESPAYFSGLQIGDILANVNGVNTDGFSHKQIVDLIKSSGNYLRLETVNEALLRRKMELETKLQLLKQALQQRCAELRALHLQEQRLLHGAVNDNEATSVASSGSLSPLWEGTGGTYHFGTLPRKSRRPSVRKQLLKFIPGLHRAVEEEESRV
ncbi:PREDICTED: cytohesin-interacting protein [Tinamus guttatus]|uniref:cytohesin-interacting protein n=1 Tax=Tinamus guttatus TaxID=94827 RepID=UPI00052F03D7|nr:PREDICTED: cytohesin-interacting protein [Tinamus guttatus]